MARVCVLNYGSGNARSVFNLFRTEGAEWWKQNLWGVPSALRSRAPSCECARPLSKARNACQKSEPRCARAGADQRFSVCVRTASAAAADCLGSPR